MAASTQIAPPPHVVIVGGGPGGLAVSQQLGARGVPSVILEKGAYPGWMWGQTYESLCLHTGRHLSALPGMPFPRGTNLFPSRAEFMSYMASYAERFHFPMRLGVEVKALERDGTNWRIETNEGPLAAPAVVVATGIMSSPVVPEIAGAESYKGNLLHSSAYREPENFAAQRVLVVGIGNSGAEIAVELAGTGARVAVSVRSGGEYRAQEHRRASKPISGVGNFLDAPASAATPDQTIRIGGCGYPGRQPNSAQDRFQQLPGRSTDRNEASKCGAVTIHSAPTRRKALYAARSGLHRWGST